MIDLTNIKINNLTIEEIFSKICGDTYHENRELFEILFLYQNFGFGDDDGEINLTFLSEELIRLLDDIVMGLKNVDKMIFLNKHDNKELFDNLLFDCFEFFKSIEIFDEDVTQYDKINFNKIKWIYINYTTSKAKITKYMNGFITRDTKIVSIKYDKTIDMFDIAIQYKDKSPIHLDVTIESTTKLLEHFHQILNNKESYFLVPYDYDDNIISKIRFNLPHINTEFEDIFKSIEDSISLRHDIPECNDYDVYMVIHTNSIIAFREFLNEMEIEENIFGTENINVEMLALH